MNQQVEKNQDNSIKLKCVEGVAAGFTILHIIA